MMLVEWMKSISTESSIRKLVDGSVLPNAAIEGWWPSIGESFPNPPSLVSSLFLKIFTSVGFEILVTHSYASFLITTKLVYAIYIPTLSCPSPSSSTFMKRTLESTPTSIYGFISSASKRKGDLGGPK
jgi:hypothetical protein